MITLDAIAIPDQGDLVWMDEFDWTPAKQQETYTLTGALVVERGYKQAGRTITLGESTLPAWITRQKAADLYAKLSANVAMALTLNDGRVFSVAWAHNQTPIQVKPVYEYVNYDGTDYYNVQSLRFITV